MRDYLKRICWRPELNGYSIQIRRWVSFSDVLQIGPTVFSLLWIRKESLMIFLRWDKLRVSFEASQVVKAEHIRQRNFDHISHLTSSLFTHYLNLHLKKRKSVVLLVANFRLVISINVAVSCDDSGFNDRYVSVAVVVPVGTRRASGRNVRARRLNVRRMRHSSGWSHVHWGHFDYKRILLEFTLQLVPR